MTSSAFALPPSLVAKSDPALVADDERHFAEVERSLAASVADLAERLRAELVAPGGSGQEAMDRDLEVHRLGSRLRTLRRFGLDLCLGRMVLAGQAEPVYVGRLGLTDADGRRLLVDWRTPAAEPFFGATHGDPRGLTSRRRYRWTQGRVTDFWDEVFTTEDLEGHAALDDQSAFLASLGSHRSSRMRDVLSTIAADQDAVVRAASAGALVVDGGPGTGKTVVALHRAAYLLHADPRLGHRRGGVLVVGPSQPYLAYVADVLPSLGEEGVQTCTVRDLVPEGARAVEEPDPRVAALKSSARPVAVVEAAVAFYEEPPTAPLVVGTPWTDAHLGPAEWAEAFAAPDPGTPHNLARDQVWEELLAILADQHGPEVPRDQLRAVLRQDRSLLAAFGRAWPLLQATDVVSDLWSVPAYLRRCAPGLADDDVQLLQRPAGSAWTVHDLPFLDAARQRLGDPEASLRSRRHEARLEAERERMAAVVDDLVAGDDSEMLVMSVLRGEDVQSRIVDDTPLDAPDPDLLAGPFAHVVVDEAQELTDAQWEALLLRCPSRSLTVVGDRAQARRGFPESWEERLARLGLDRVRTASLRLNYRTPEEVMAEAEPVIRAAVPDANVPTSVRASGLPVVHGARADLAAVVDAWLSDRPEGVACVVGDPAYPDGERVRSLPPELVKGLEFDLVVLVDPESFGDGVAGAVDRYVAMTRATSQLVVLS